MSNQEEITKAITETKKALVKLNKQYIAKTMRENAETTAFRKLNDSLVKKGFSREALHASDKYWIQNVDSIYSSTPIKLP